MRRTLKSLLVSLCVLAASTSQAAKPTCDPNDAEVCSAPLKLNEPAPFAGQLLTTKLAIQLGQKAENFTERLKIEVEYIKRVYQTDVDLERQLRTIEKDMWAAQKKTLEEALEKALQPAPFYERPWFVATVTSVVVLTVTGIVLFVAVRVIEATRITPIIPSGYVPQ